GVLGANLHYGHLLRGVEHLRVGDVGGDRLFFSSRRRHTRSKRDWSSDVCSSDLTRPVAVVSEAFAKRFFGSESPIGRHFGPAPEKNAGMYEIVGVASDVDFADGLKPVYWLPEAQSTQFDDPESEEREVSSHYLYNVVIWAPGNPPRLKAQATRALAHVDPNLLIYGVQSYLEFIYSEY